MTSGSATLPRSGLAVRSRGGRLGVLAGLTLALAATCALAAGIGAVPIPVGDVLGAVAERLGWDVHLIGRTDYEVLWQIRFPRVLLGALVGASLASSGAVMQGVFGNPLADPGIVGVSSGAAVGAVGAIVLGVSAFGGWSVTLLAFVGGLVTTALVYLGARSGGRTEVVTLILTGVAVNAIAGGVIGMFTFLADDDELRDLTFWSLGSLGGAGWSEVGLVAVCTGAGLALLPRYARSLDLLGLGPSSAQHLGVDVERLRAVLLVLVALLVSAAVSVCGVIGFVGLVVPHMLRLTVGPGHRLLLPASALGGGIVVVLADLAARQVVLPAEAPLGVLTAVLGGPFFLWLLRRTRRHQGGWA